MLPRWKEEGTAILDVGHTKSLGSPSGMTENEGDIVTTERATA